MAVDWLHFSENKPQQIITYPHKSEVTFVWNLTDPRGGRQKDLCAFNRFMTFTVDIHTDTGSFFKPNEHRFLNARI